MNVPVKKTKQSKSSNVWQNQQGLTLLETLVAISIFSIMLTVLGSVTHLGSLTYVRIFNHSSLMLEARQTLQVMRKDIQRLIPEAIVQMDQNNFSFTDVEGKFIHYQFQNGKFLRNGKIFNTYLKTFPFDYLNIEQKKAPTINSLKFIHIRLPLIYGIHQLKVDELVYVRN